MTPKTVIFDLGKVLVDFDFTIAARKVMKRSLRPPSPLSALTHFSPLVCRFERGELTDRQFFDEVCSVTGYQGTFEEFAEEFSNIFTEMPEMIALHARLRAAGVPTYILSNTNTLAEGYLRRHYPFFANFDGYVFSYAVRAMKPEAAIYEAAERLCGCRGEEILFIDDRRENVEGGTARGWQGLVQESPAKTIAALRKLGLPA
jgi:putative hydrolase of the HAD superfamily